MESEFIVYDSSNDHCLSRWRNVVIMCWRGGVVADLAYDGLDRVAVSAMNQFGKIITASIIEQGASPPSAAQRAKMAATMDKVAPNTIGAPMLILGNTFKEVMVRSVVTMIMLTMKGQGGPQVFKNVSTASQWTAELLKKTYQTDAVEVGMQFELARISGLLDSDERKKKLLGGSPNRT